MKAVVLRAPGDAALLDLPEPQPGPDEVRLRVEAAGMCATDAHIFGGHFAVPMPRVLGHELAGTVDAAGSGVDARWLGARVGVQPARFCGACRPCREGRPELCARFECLGNTHDGGYAEFTVVRVDQLVRLERITPAQAVWLEPVGCVVQALGGVRVRGPALVAGAGTFGGLFAQLLARVHGVSVAVADPNPERVERARRLGASAGWTVPRDGPTPEADAAIASWSDGGPALLVDTTGRAESIARLVRWAGPGATVLLFGVSAPEERLTLSPASLFAREVTLTASAGVTPEAFVRALDLLGRGALETAPLVAGTIALEAAPDALRRLPAGKLIIAPG